MIYAMFVVSILTIMIGLIAVRARIASVSNGQVKARYFKLMQGQEVPEIVTKTTRCVNNMFEVPVLFYVVCTLYVVLGIESLFGLVFAWLFVIFRTVHAYIHITYNLVRHRMYVFGAAVLCVLFLWVNLIAQRI
jgi:hypothetical protein